MTIISTPVEVSEHFINSAWISFFLTKKRMRWEMAMKIMKAKRHHAHRLMRVHLNEWKVCKLTLCTSLEIEM